MLHLHPELVLICDVSYNKKKSLVVSEHVHTFHVRDQLSVRYLNRITESTCADDGLISCRTKGPDRVTAKQVPPPALFAVKRAKQSVSPLVYLDSMSVGTSRREKCVTVGPTGRQHKRCRLPRAHNVVNAHIHPRLEGRQYLFPYVDKLCEGQARKFARVPVESFEDLLETLRGSCSVDEYHEALRGFEIVSLRCLDVGEDGVSGIFDPEKEDGGVDEDYSEPVDRSGPTYMSWLPVKNSKTGQEALPDELDGRVNVDSILRVMSSTHGRAHNAKRQVVDSAGLNVFMGTYAKVGDSVVFVYIIFPNLALALRPERNQSEWASRTYPKRISTTRTST